MMTHSFYIHKNNNNTVFKEEEKKKLNPTFPHYPMSYSSKGEKLLPEDLAALKSHHQFIRDDDADRRDMTKSWEVRMARKYYNKLYKEFALADLSLFEEGKIGLRWRTEQEVVIGKGQFSCGSLTCTETREMRGFEVPFRYKENGVVKCELVKVKVCENCAKKLYYKKMQSMSKKKDGSKRAIESCSSGTVKEDDNEDDDSVTTSKRQRKSIE
jgi:protein FRA10AC1